MPRLMRGMSTSPAPSSAPSAATGGADLRHHLSHEVFGLLVDAGTDLEALKFAHVRPGALEQRLDGALRVLDEGLPVQADLGQRLAQPSGHHLGDDLRVLAFRSR